MIDEMKAQQELRDRLDRIRAMADARIRVSTYLDSHAAARIRVEDDDPGVIDSISGHPLTADDLGLVLDAAAVVVGVPEAVERMAAEAAAFDARLRDPEGQPYGRHDTERALRDAGFRREAERDWHDAHDEYRGAHGHE